jgi:hypothetical protein
MGEEGKKIGARGQGSVDAFMHLASDLGNGRFSRSQTELGNAFNLQDQLGNHLRSQVQLGNEQKHRLSLLFRGWRNSMLGFKWITLDQGVLGREPGNC